MKGVLVIVFCVVFSVVIPATMYAQSNYSVATRELRSRTGKAVGPNEFPPSGSETRFWACLVSVDPINRRGVLRWEDRDRLLNFELLPYAPLFYRGAPASLGDIPPGTMVEVWGLGDTRTDLPRNVLRMSDAASVQAFDQIAFEVQSVNTRRRTFRAVPKPDGRESPLPYVPEFTTEGDLHSKWDEDVVTFTFNDQTAWYLGDRIVSQEALEPGQLIRVNFIRKFYEGPPVITRCTEVWLDHPSQDLAATNQHRAFTAYLRDRGFPLRVDRVDDQNKRLSVTLLETGLNSVFEEWSVGTNHDFSASTTSLRMWEPSGGQATPDRMREVRLLEMTPSEIGYGRGGITMEFSVPKLYEAYRPGTIIKLYPNNHPVPILPIEERMPKEFDTFLR